MNPPTMPLKVAWRVLGRDLAEIMNDLVKIKDPKARAKAIVALLENAKKTSKSLMAEHHPDKKPDDSTTASRFKEVNEALSCIEWHTNDILTKMIQKYCRPKNTSVVIEIY
jgi:hypothetical protein